MQLKVKSVGNTNPSGRGMNGNVFDSDYLCPTLTTNKGEGIKILIKNATKKGYLIAEDGDGIDLAYPDSKTRRGRVQRNMAHTLTTDDSKGVVVGTIYTNDSKRFHRGIYKDLSRTVKANNHDLAVVIGASRGRDPKNPSDRKAGNSNLEQRLEINKNGTSNTITTVQKDNYVVECNVLTPKRTEYGKAIRKDYEKGLIKESRHNMTEMQPRTDGISNTLTTVQKDNLVVESANEKNAVINKLPTDSDGIDFVGYLDGNKRIKDPTEDQLKLSRTHRQPNRIHSDHGIHPALSASEVSGRCNIMGDKTNFRIRKLTPKECWRLMGCSDEDFHKAEQVNSNTQLYKQAGNAIVVNVLEAIFKQMFLKELVEE